MERLSANKIRFAVRSLSPRFGIKKQRSGDGALGGMKARADAAVNDPKHCARRERCELLPPARRESNVLMLIRSFAKRGIAWLRGKRGRKANPELAKNSGICSALVLSVFTKRTIKGDIIGVSSRQMRISERGQQYAPPVRNALKSLLS